MPAAKVIMRVDSNATTLIVEGDRPDLRVLSANLRDLAMYGDVDEHLHVDYFPDHFYLGESSLPVVFRIAT